MEIIIFSVIGAIVGMIIVFSFFGSNSSKYRCSHCQSPNNDIKDAKSEDFAHTKFAHTTKDGNRDRRYNQSGTKVYDLVFDCVDCGKEFKVASNAYVGSSIDKTVHGLIKGNPEFGKALDDYQKSVDEWKKKVDKKVFKPTSLDD